MKKFIPALVFLTANRQNHDYDEDHHKNVLPQPLPHEPMDSLENIGKGIEEENQGQGPVGAHPRNIPPPHAVGIHPEEYQNEVDEDFPNHHVIAPPRVDNKYSRIEQRDEQGQYAQNDFQKHDGKIYHNAQEFYKSKHWQKHQQVEPQDKMLLDQNHGRFDLSGLLVIVTCVVLLVVICRVFGGRRLLYKYKPLLKM